MPTSVYRQDSDWPLELKICLVAVRITQRLSEQPVKVSGHLKVGTTTPDATASYARVCVA
jgi:hypothetical protein